MSEPRLISPLLDNFVMGAPISDHDGVRCCPAMDKDSDKKYIVKIISIPSSQVRLDALLLTGAYQDRDAAKLYFGELADGVVREAQILQRLSQLEGFLSYDSWQIVPMEDGTGFDVYLLSPYKRSLERYCRRNTMTHLNAVNLGLDLCAALAVCRRAGYLYVDLKPENVFLTDNQGYLIGDLGFLSLSSLKYASLPDKYRSVYTAPEITDAFASVNTTVDIYAVGMILYHVFNGGTLPFEQNDLPAQQLPPPLYADYEMAEIIAKACAQDPAERWQDPIEMGQALIGYMQRNGANDTPIVPPPVHLEDLQEPAPVSSEDAMPEDEGEPTTELSAGEPAIDEAVPGEAEPSLYTEDDYGNLSFLLTDDETAPDPTDAQIPYNEVTDEVSDILNQADDLISHPTPEPVVPPEKIDVPVPSPIELPKEPEPEADTSEEAAPQPEADQSDNKPESAEEIEEDEPDEADEAPEKKRKSRRGLIRSFMVLILILFLLAAGAGGFYYYETYYLQPIGAITLDGSETSLSVILTSDIPDELLTVVCEDTYGNKKYSPVSGGKATFTDLIPNTGYTIQVDIDGFHKLTGTTTGAYTTPAQTNIVQLNAVTGAESGSVILSLTVDGPEPDQWQLLCTAPEEEDRSIAFTGHTATITGLTVGTDYTFTLQPISTLYLTGVLECQFTASDLIYAQNLAITACSDGILKASWSAPEGVEVSSWTVRCYSDGDYSETIVTSHTDVTFEGIDETAAYTIEVTAAGMSVSERAYVSANSLTVTGFHAEADGASRLRLSWDCANIPQDGWVLLYTMDSIGSSERVETLESSAVIDPVIPGTTYHFTLQAKDATVLGGGFSYSVPDATSFSGYGVTAPNMVFSMCRTPADPDWDRTDLDDSSYTTTFSSGEQMSFLVRLREEYEISDDTIVILYVIRDADGVPVSVSTQKRTWTSMWYRGYGEFDVPKLPSTPGSYTITIYFNDQITSSQSFTII